MMAAPAPPRQISIAKPTAASRQSGVLPAPAVAATNRSSNPPQKAREAKLKVVVRRLAPGLTEQEFRLALGEDWKVGGGKVDWTTYQKGKIARDAAKPSRPSRAYLHLTSQQHLGPLSDKIRSTQFIDAKGSFNDSILLGPPVLVFTPYSKIPGKARADGRQGTIDQDPEFIDFLTGLTNPVVKPPNIDALPDKENKSETKIITPLVQYIKDKKANKAKDGKSQKHGRQESKDGKAEDKKQSGKAGKGKATVIDKKAQARADKSGQETPNKVAKKASPAAAQTPTSPTAQPAATATTNPTPPKSERRRERGNASRVAQILQRDLGIGNGAPSRRKRDNSSATAVSENQNTVPASSIAQGTSTTSESSAVSNLLPAISSTTNVPAQAPTGPAVTRKQQSQIQSTQSAQSGQTQQSGQAAAKSPAVVSSTATQAFLKHANPSQGVTETLLEEVFKTFGPVTKVDIDKKKGFAYIDFTESSSLSKAIAASPVKVGQGQVVVLERKTGAMLQNRNARGSQTQNNQNPVPNRGGRGGGRGRSGRGSSGNSKNATPVTTAPSTPVPAPT